jgi:hypothetical protein
MTRPRKLAPAVEAEQILPHASSTNKWLASNSVNVQQTQAGSLFNDLAAKFVKFYT